MSPEDTSTASTSRAPVPEGTIPVAIATVVGGVSTYVFFKIGQQALGQDGFKPIVTMWFIAFALVPGFFLPLEQETSRALAHRRALGQGGLPVIKRIIPLATIILAGLLVALALAARSATNNLFESNSAVTLALLFMLLTYAPMHIARGLSSGQGKFSNYALIIGLDGTIRVGVCAALWLSGVDSTGIYAVAVGLSPIVGVIIVAVRGDLRLTDGPPASWSEITPNLGWLLLGSLFAAALVNAGPITVDILGSDEPAAVVTRFGNAVIFARVPLFLFQAVQAALLPKLARLAAQRDMVEFRTGLRRLILLVVGVGVVGTIGAFAIGPWVLELVYEGGIDRRTMSLLAAASAIYMLALALAQAVIALHGHAAVAYGWIIGFATFVLVAWLSSDDLYLRVELALVASSVVALAVFTWVAKKRLDEGSSADVASVIEAITERPLD